MKSIAALEFLIPKRELAPSVYDTRRSYQNMVTELFKKSYTPEDVSKFTFEAIKPLKPAFDFSICDGLEICNLPVREVGCGIIATAQAMTEGYNAVESQEFKKLVEIIESKGYYYPGRGLWWHWMDNFTSRICHWADMYNSLKAGLVVTVLVKYPEHSRNHFTNLVGAYNDEAGELIFITTDGELSLENLMKIIVTAPWRWNY